MSGLPERLPIELAALESLARVRIGNLACRGDVGEFLAPALGHRAREIAREIAEIKEWRRGAELLAHEEHWRRRREEKDRACEPQRLRIGEGAQALAEGAVADLVVVLQEVDEGFRREMRARLATPRLAISGMLPLIHIAFGERAGELALGFGGVVGAKAAVFAGEEHAHGMVPVVVPLRRRMRAARGIEQARLVLVVLEHEVHVALATRARGDR